MSIDTLLAYWTGLAFVAPGLERPALLGSALVLHICHAALCHVFAGAAGRARLAWTVAGFIGGILAVVLVIVLGRPVGAAPLERPVR